MPNPLLDPTKYTSEEAQQSLLEEQENLLKQLQQRAQPNWFQIAGALARPTKTGSALEALGAGAESYGQQQQEIEKMQPSIVQMRAQLGAQRHQMAVDSAVKEAQNRLLENPNDKQAMSVIARYSPTGFKEMFALQQTNKLKDAQTRFLNDPTDKEAIADLMQNSPNGIKDVIELSKSAPRVKALISGTNSEESTPFDVLVAVNDPVIAGQAKLLRKRYLNGSIDPEKADTLGKDLLTLYTSSNDKKILHGALSGVNAQLKQLQVDKIIQEMQGKLTDEQKITFNKIIVPSIQEADKANKALMQIDSLLDIVSKAPSGILEGVKAKSIGALFGTDDNTALREITRTTKSLITQIPRLPGSQSNLDARSLEKSLGDLSDPYLTNRQRLELIEKIREDFERLSDRGDEIRSYWEKNKALHPDITKREKQPESTKKFKILGVEKPQ